MSELNLFEHADALSQKFDHADEEARLAMQPQLSRLINQFEAEGTTIPRKLRYMNAVLVEEAIEAQFDNLPV